MNGAEHYINIMNASWNAMNASTRHVYDNQVVDGMEQVCCGFFVAVSIMSTAVFAAYAEWF